MITQHRDDRLGVGVIGCAGFMAQSVYLPELKANPAVRIAGLSDARPDLGERVAEQYGVPRLHASAHALMCDPEVQAVFVLTQPWTHAELARDCMAAGKAVFVEKPLALRSADARSLARQARGRSQTLWVGYMKRHDELCQRAIFLRERLADQLGRCLSVVIEVSLGKWREGAGAAVRGAVLPPPGDLGLPPWVSASDRSVFFNLASGFSHDVNLLQALCGQPSSVDGIRFQAEGRHSASIACLLGYEGYEAALMFRVVDPGAPWQERASLVFDRGRIELEIGAPLLEGSATTLTLQLRQHTRTWSCPSRTAFTTQVGAFVDHVRRGARSWVMGEEATSDLELVEELYHTWARQRGDVPAVEPAAALGAVGAAAGE